MAGNPTLLTENIDGVILRLLKLESDTEIDYQTYFEKIKKKLASTQLVGKQLPLEEKNLLEEELKRVWKIKDRQQKRIKIKEKTVRISPEPKSFSGKNKSPLKIGTIVKAPFSGITKDFIKPQVEPTSVKDVAEKTTKINKDIDILQSISKTLDSILNTIINIENQKIKEREKNRRSEEEKKRIGKENSLESKSFEGIKKAISVITKPFQSIWDTIVNFITNIILGRIVVKLIDWFADPKNESKIKSLIRFVKDWWPVLLGSYILFGTKFGGLIRFIGGWAARLSFQLAKVVLPKLLSLVIKNPVASLAIAAGVGAYAASQQNKSKRDEFAKTDSSIVKPEETAATGKTPSPIQLSQEQIGQQGLGLAFNGGGAVRIPAFGGGGLNIKDMLGGASIGSMFGPLGMLLGGALGSGKPQEMMSGFVSGEKGVDKIPAMLSDGEFVMSAGAVKKYGVDTLESMNAAGGGTNIPKVVGGKTYAAGGGLIGDVPINWLTSNMTDEGAKSLAQSYSAMGSNSLGLTSEEWYNAFKRYKGVPDFDKLLGEGKPFTKWESTRTPLSKEQLDTIRQVVRGNNPGSAYSRPKSINAANSAENVSTGSRLRTARMGPNRMLPTAGQSSANAMRAAQKTSRVVRQPIPASRAIVPYTGGGLARTGVTGGLSIPEIRTNLKVPGGFGNIKSLGTEMLANYLMDRGFDRINAMIIAKKIDDGKKLTGNKRENYIEKLRNIVDREERWQRGFGGIFDRILGMGKETNSEKLSIGARQILEGIGSGSYKGGAIKGGWGLSEKSFKDAPKTQIMTDEKGRPFVGHKALRNGKLTYVRGPQPGTGTTNPFEMLGRMINPGAYKDSDSRLKSKTQREVLMNSLEGFQRDGMAPDAQARMIKQMGGNLKEVQNDLTYRQRRTKEKAAEQNALMSGNDKSAVMRRNNAARISAARISTNKSSIKPAVRPLPRRSKVDVINAGGSELTKSRGANPPRTGSKPPIQSPIHRGGTKTSAAVLGITR